MTVASSTAASEEETIRKLEGVITENTQVLADSSKERMDTLEPRRDEIMKCLDSGFAQGRSDSDGRIAADLKAKLYEKGIELEHLKNFNDNIEGLLNTRDDLLKDTDHQLDTYSYMKYQKEQLEDVLGQIMEDTENHRKAREIDRKLDAMKDDIANDGNKQLSDKRGELSDLERELGDLKGKVKDQDKLLGDIEAKIAALKRQIENDQNK